MSGQTGITRDAAIAELRRRSATGDREAQDALQRLGVGHGGEQTFRERSEAVHQPFEPRNDAERRMFEAYSPEDQARIFRMPSGDMVYAPDSHFRGRTNLSSYMRNREMLGNDTAAELATGLRQGVDDLGYMANSAVLNVGDDFGNLLGWVGDDVLGLDIADALRTGDDYQLEQNAVAEVSPQARIVQDTGAAVGAVVPATQAGYIAATAPGLAGRVGGTTAGQVAAGATGGYVGTQVYAQGTYNGEQEMVDTLLDTDISSALGLGEGVTVRGLGPLLGGALPAAPAAGRAIGRGLRSAADAISPRPRAASRPPSDQEAFDRAVYAEVGERLGAVQRGLRGVADPMTTEGARRRAMAIAAQDVGGDVGAVASRQGGVETLADTNSATMARLGSAMRMGGDRAQRARSFYENRAATRADRMRGDFADAIGAPRRHVDDIVYGPRRYAQELVDRRAELGHERYGPVNNLQISDAPLPASVRSWDDGLPENATYRDLASDVARQADAAGLTGKARRLEILEHGREARSNPRTIPDDDVLNGMSTAELKELMAEHGLRRAQVNRRRINNADRIRYLQEKRDVTDAGVGPVPELDAARAAPVPRDAANARLLEAEARLVEAKAELERATPSGLTPAGLERFRKTKRGQKLRDNLRSAEQEARRARALKNDADNASTGADTGRKLVLGDDNVSVQRLRAIKTAANDLAESARVSGQMAEARAARRMADRVRTILAEGVRDTNHHRVSMLGDIYHEKLTRVIDAYEFASGTNIQTGKSAGPGFFKAPLDETITFVENLRRIETEILNDTRFLPETRQRVRTEFERAFEALKVGSTRAYSKLIQPSIMTRGAKTFEDTPDIRTRLSLLAGDDAADDLLARVERENVYKETEYEALNRGSPTQPRAAKDAETTAASGGRTFDVIDGVRGLLNDAIMGWLGPRLQNVKLRVVDGMTRRVSDELATILSRTDLDEVVKELRAAQTERRPVQMMQMPPAVREGALSILRRAMSGERLPEEGARGARGSAPAAARTDQQRGPIRLTEREREREIRRAARAARLNGGTQDGLRFARDPEWPKMRDTPEGARVDTGEPMPDRPPRDEFGEPETLRGAVDVQPVERASRSARRPSAPEPLRQGRAPAEGPTWTPKDIRPAEPGPVKAQRRGPLTPEELMSAVRSGDTAVQTPDGRTIRSLSLKDARRVAGLVRAQDDKIAAVREKLLRLRHVEQAGKMRSRIGELKAKSKQLDDYNGVLRSVLDDYSGALANTQRLLSGERISSVVNRLAAGQRLRNLKRSLRIEFLDAIENAYLLYRDQVHGRLDAQQALADLRAIETDGQAVLSRIDELDLQLAQSSEGRMQDAARIRELEVDLGSARTRGDEAATGQADAEGRLLRAEEDLAAAQGRADLAGAQAREASMSADDSVAEARMQLQDAETRARYAEGARADLETELREAMGDLAQARDDLRTAEARVRASDASAGASDARARRDVEAAQDEIARLKAESAELYREVEGLRDRLERLGGRAALQGGAPTEAPRLPASMDDVNPPPGTYPPIDYVRERIERLLGSKQSVRVMPDGEALGVYNAAHLGRKQEFAFSKHLLEMETENVEKFIRLSWNTPSGIVDATIDHEVAEALIRFNVFNDRELRELSYAAHLFNQQNFDTVGYDLLEAYRKAGNAPDEITREAIANFLARGGLKQMPQGQARRIGARIIAALRAAMRQVLTLLRMPGAADAVDNWRRNAWEMAERFRDGAYTNAYQKMVAQTYPY